MLLAVSKIRKFMTKNGFSGQLNYKSMTVHALCFSLYCLAIIVFLFSFLVFTFQARSGKPSEQVARTLWITWTIVAYTNFAAQLFLVWIFLSYRKRPQDVDIKRKVITDATDPFSASVTRLTSLESDNQYAPTKDKDMQFEEAYSEDYDEELDNNPLMRHDMLNVDLFLSTAAEEDDLHA